MWRAIHVHMDPSHTYARCVSLLIVTELAKDKEAREFTRWFARASQARTAVRVLDKELCDGPCAFHTLAQSDVLVSVTSAFSYTAAMVTKDAATLAFAGHDERGGAHTANPQVQALARAYGATVRDDASAAASGSCLAASSALPHQNRGGAWWGRR